MRRHLSVSLLCLTLHCIVIQTQELPNETPEEQNSINKRLDRYHFYSTLGKRQNEELSDGIESKRAMDYRMFRSTLGKRNTDGNFINPSYPYDSYLNKENIDENDSKVLANDENKIVDEYSDNDDEVEKRAMDSHFFNAMLGKRLDNRMFFGQLGKRGKLDNRMFFGQLGKRLDNRMFFGRLGKRMDFRMFSGKLGKRSRMDNNMFYGQLGKRSEPMMKRGYYYKFGSRGRPIYTQTRGMDRFSFAARLGKRNGMQGDNY